MRLLLPLCLLMSACNHVAAWQPPMQAASTEYRLYDATRDAEADFDAALARVADSERKVIVSMGGNWCHDSRGLAEHFADPTIVPILAEHFEVVYVDVGVPQKGEGRNAELAESFGVAPLVGTPTMVILNADGEVLNREDAPSWRNAHSRTTESVRDYLLDFVDP